MLYVLESLKLKLELILGHDRHVAVKIIIAWKEQCYCYIPSCVWAGSGCHKAVPAARRRSDFLLYIETIAMCISSLLVIHSTFRLLILTLNSSLLPRTRKCVRTTRWILTVVPSTALHHAWTPWPCRVDETTPPSELPQNNNFPPQLYQPGEFVLLYNSFMNLKIQFYWLAFC